MYGSPYFIRNKWSKDIFIRSKERKKIYEKMFEFPYFMSNQRFFQSL